MSWQNVHLISISLAHRIVTIAREETICSEIGKDQGPELIEALTS